MSQRKKVRPPALRFAPHEEVNLLLRMEGHSQFATFASRRGSETTFVHGRVKTPNASPEAIELNPRCSGQAQSKGPRTGFGNENMEYGGAFEILCALSIIRPLSYADAQFR